MEPGADVVGWMLVAVAVWALFTIALEVRELIWYYKHQGIVKP